MYEVLSSYLENGLKVIIHKLPNTKTVSCGIWVKQGSKYEDDQSNGISHLIEHLLINSSNTKNDRYREVIKELEFNGVQYNATTTKEHTHYYFTGLENNLNLILDALSNIVMNNKDIYEDKLETEKDIVIQEILSYYSSVNQIIERTNQALWGNMDVGRIIVGSAKNIQNITYKQVRDVIDKAYTPENSVVVIVGNVDYNKALEFVSNKFSSWKDIDTRTYTEIVNSMPGIYLNNNSNGKTSALSIGFRLDNNYKDNLIPIEIVSTILGNPSLDSRLVKKIRIEKGLVYSLNSFISKYSSRGTLGFSAITANENIENVITLILEELKDVKQNFFKDEEIKKAKNILEMQSILKINDLEKHLRFLGNCSIDDRIFSLENEIRMIRKCSNEMIQNAIDEIFVNSNIGLAAIGKFDSDKIVELINI